jgi:hypothetical protein
MRCTKTAASGNVIKSATGKIGSGSTLLGYGAAQKFSYDSLGRVVMSYTCFDTDEISYADADDVVGDTVLEQTQTWYDQASEAVATATYQRLPTYNSTGALSAANSYATASVVWYDGIGRAIETADFGREDTTSGLSHVFFVGTTGNPNPIDANANGLPDAAETASAETPAFRCSAETDPGPSRRAAREWSCIGSRDGRCRSKTADRSGS